MKIKEIKRENLGILKILLALNTVVILTLGGYYLFKNIINTNTNPNIFDTYIFLPLFLALLGAEVMLMSTLSYNSSFRSNGKQDSTMFNIGLILEAIAFVTIFLLILINKLK